MSFPTSIYIAMRYKVGYSFKTQSLADGAAVSDVAAFTVMPQFTEAVSATDAFAAFLGRSFTDAVSVTDAFQVLFNGGTLLTSTAETLDFGAWRMQDYCDFTYFEADYVGSVGTF